MKKCVVLRDVVISYGPQKLFAGQTVELPDDVVAALDMAGDVTIITETTEEAATVVQEPPKKVKK